MGSYCGSRDDLTRVVREWRCTGELGQGGVDSDREAAAWKLRVFIT